MASPGAIASSLKHLCWNPRKSDFFPSFDAEIELERSVIRPFKPIKGNLKLTTSKLVKFHGGIRVQLDANVRLRFQSKFDNRIGMNWAVESIFKDAPEPDEGNYVESPVMIRVFPPAVDETAVTLDQPCVMEPGTYCYPFTLYLPVNEPLPAPFKSQFGSLQFHVAAYMGSAYCYVQIAEQLVNFGGFLDLTKIPKISDPVSTTSHVYESIFSSKPLVTFTLAAEKTGYHPGDKISFTFTVDNPKEKEITTVIVNLVRKVTYTAHGVPKVTSTTLDTWTNESMELQQTYPGELVVPKPCIPTFTEKTIYRVDYLICYEVVVRVGNLPAMGKGQAEIIIGTTKPSAALLVNRLQSRRGSGDMSPTSETPGQSQPISRSRSHSICARSDMRPIHMPHGNVYFNETLPSPMSNIQKTFSMLSVKEL